MHYLDGFVSHHQPIQSSPSKSFRNNEIHKLFHHHPHLLLFFPILHHTSSLHLIHQLVNSIFPHHCYRTRCWWQLCWLANNCSSSQTSPPPSGKPQTVNSLQAEATTTTWVHMKRCMMPGVEKELKRKRGAAVSPTDPSSQECERRTWRWMWTPYSMWAPYSMYLMGWKRRVPMTHKLEVSHLELEEGSAPSKQAKKETNNQGMNDLQNHHHHYQELYNMHSNSSSSSSCCWKKLQSFTNPRMHLLYTIEFLPRTKEKKRKCSGQKKKKKKNPRFFLLRRGS